MASALETWMVDYEHGDGEPQHAVLSWIDDEATALPEVGTQLVRLEDVKEQAQRAVRDLDSLREDIQRHWTCEDSIADQWALVSFKRVRDFLESLS